MTNVLALMGIMKKSNISTLGINTPNAKSNPKTAPDSPIVGI
jgi:hypothetical protein